VWDEALCAIDMATLLDPADPEVRAAADGARSILARLGARPMLERLDVAASRASEDSHRATGSAVSSGDVTAVSG
jgi:hypothetical protein